MTIILSKDFEFESAQSLPRFPEGHKCRQMHGHSFKLTVSVRGPVDEATGIFFDHAVISKAMRPIVDQLDHAYAQRYSRAGNPTIELMSRWLWKKLEPQLPGLSNWSCTRRRGLAAFIAAIRFPLKSDQAITLEG